MSTIKTIIRVAAPIIVLGIGGLSMAGLIASKPEAEEKPPSERGIVVRTTTVSVEPAELSISAQGTVLAAREVELQTEVPGRVVFRSKNLVPGGRFKKGELLLRLDPGEYSLRAAQSAAQVEQARQQLALEESRGELAQEEWTIIGEDKNASETGRAAALRKPHRAEAEARMTAAQGERDLALLNVTRTGLVAPFNGFVRDSQVDVGRYISPGMQLGSLVASDTFWVQVSVPVDKLQHILVPGFNAQEGEGSVVRVWQDLGEIRVERRGRVLRLYGDLDPVGRMARVLVEVQDPLGIDLPAAERSLPLLLGAYVHVAIAGKNMIQVVEIPREALHAGRYVYVFGPDARLDVREVEIAWRKENTLLIKKGLDQGDEIITSRLGSVVAGTHLRRADAPEAAVPAPSSHAVAEGATPTGVPDAPPSKPAVTQQLTTPAQASEK